MVRTKTSEALWECQRFTQIVDCSNVHSLYLIWWEGEGMEFLLNSLPKLQYLTLCDADIESMANQPPILEKLKGIAFGDEYDANGAQRMIQTHGKRWDSLSAFDQKDGINWNLSGVIFANLIELSAANLYRFDPIDQITKTASNLKRVRFFQTAKTIDSFTEVASQVIIRCKKLESITFLFSEWSQSGGESVDEELTAIDGIANGLYDTQKRHRKQFRINISLICRMGENNNKATVWRYICSILLVIKRLTESQIQHWMVMLEVVHFDDFGDYDSKQFIAALKRAAPREIETHFMEPNKLIFSKRNCIINGPHDSWNLDVGYETSLYDIH